MAPISNNPSLIEGLRYTAGTDKIQNISSSPRRSYSAYQKYATNDIKNTIVSEKPDSYSGVAGFYRYKYNAPASRLLYTGQTFNEIEKPLNNGKSYSYGGKNTAAENSQPQNYNIYENAVGYYIVSNIKQTKSQEETRSKKSNPMKKKLEKTYHSGSDNPTGSLVNIIYY